MGLEALETKLQGRRELLEALVGDQRNARDQYDAALAKGDTNRARMVKLTGSELADEIELMEASVRVMEAQLREAVEADREAAVEEMIQLRTRLLSEAVSKRDQLDKGKGNPEDTCDAFRAWLNLTCLLHELTGRLAFQYRGGLSSLMLDHADACQSLSPHQAFTRKLPTPWSELEARARRGREGEAA